MITCTRRLEFDAGHRVPLHESKCKSLHGHRYVVEITCQAEELTREGFVVDFGVVKQKVGRWIDDNLDHTTILQLHDPLEAALRTENIRLGLRPVFLMDGPPTAENLAMLLFTTASALLVSDRLRVVEVVVHETPNCSARYRRFPVGPNEEA